MSQFPRSATASTMAPTPAVRPNNPRWPVRSARYAAIQCVAGIFQQASAFPDHPYAYAAEHFDHTVPDTSA
ncbi:hypothetical protein, partial [Nocardia sp. NPDC059228]|uniref:hypothetical protein n=1 Tax=Nocardia sp. NPDC059228 TaxID=3346777 RepID=UPI003675B21E